MNLMHTIKNLNAINEDKQIQTEIDEATRFNANLIKKAIKIANSKKYAHGDFDHAYNAIEKLKKGLADDPIVAKALKRANESVEFETDLDSLFEEELFEGNLAKQWQKGAKSVKSGNLEFVRGKGSHTIKKNGKVIGNFSLDTDVDKWVANVKGERGQLTVDEIDDFVKQIKEEVVSEDYFNVQYYDKKGKAVKGGKTFKTKPEADKYAKRGNAVDRVGGTYKVLAVKGRMESVELDEVNNGLGSFVSQMKLLLKDPKAKKAHRAASSLIMRAQEKGAMAKTAVSAIKKALPGLAKKAGGKWEKKILGMKTMLIEEVELEGSVELTEAKVSLEKGDGYEVYTSGKTSQGVMLFLSYKGKIIASGSRKDDQFVFGFKHKDIHPNARYQPAGMVKKGKDFTHMGFKTAKEVIAYAKKLKITEDIKLDELSRK